MEIQNTPSQFRLAAVLYADNNQEVNTEDTHIKILKSVFLETKNREMNIFQLIDYIQDVYFLHFEEENTREIVTKNEHFNVAQLNGELSIHLKHNYYVELNSTLTNKTIEDYINLYITEFEENENIKDLIYKYLHEILNTNFEVFSKLLNSNSSQEERDKILNTFRDEDKIRINKFLDWENSEKDKAIFAISNMALEYCLLTNKENEQNIKLDSLKNKTFYLDTNIIYRAIGINGIDRKSRTEIFLNKFVENSEDLKISIYTDKEFRDSLQWNIDKLREYTIPRASSKYFLTLNLTQDMYTYYHSWRHKRINENLDIFKAQILSDYNALISKFKIDIDKEIPEIFDNIEGGMKLTEYISDIQNFKVDNIKYTHIDQIEHDAKNIMWVESKRTTQLNSILDTNCFFISTDQNLCRWDAKRGLSCPIVMLPSHWLTIILRYISGTEDDYKSFVSFLNLKVQNQAINNEQFQTVLAGITEVVTDIQTQDKIVESLVESKFKKLILPPKSSKDDIFKLSEEFAQREADLIIENEKIKSKEMDTINKGLLSNLEQQAQQAQLKIKSIESQRDINKRKLLGDAKASNDDTIRLANIESTLDSLRPAIKTLEDNKNDSIQMRKFWFTLITEIISILVLIIFIINLFKDLNCEILKSIGSITTYFIDKWISSAISILGIVGLFLRLKELYILTPKIKYADVKKEQINYWKEEHPEYAEKQLELAKLEGEKNEILVRAHSRSKTYK